MEVAGLLADPARHAVMSAAARELARPGRRGAVADLVHGGRRAGETLPTAGGGRRRRPREPPVTGAAGLRPDRGRDRDPAPARRQDRPRRARSRATRRCGSGGPADLFAVAHNALRAARPGPVRAGARDPAPAPRAGQQPRHRGRRVPRAGDPGPRRGCRAWTATATSRTPGCRWRAPPPRPRRAGLTGLEYGLAIPGTVGRRGLGERRCARLATRRGCWSPRRSCSPTAREAVLAGRGPRLRATATAGSRTQPPAARARRDHPVRGVPARTRGPGRDQGAPRRHPCAGGASTSRWGSRRPARCSATRRATPPGG